MKSLNYAILISAAVFLVNCSDDSSTVIDDDLNFIANTVAGFSRAINRNDTSDLATLVSDSVTIIHPNKPAQEGLTAFNRFILKSNWEQFQMASPKIEHSGEISIVTSIINFKIDQTKPKDPIKYNGEILLYIRRQEDGFWKIKKLVYSSWKSE